MRDSNPQTIYLKDYQVPDYLIHTVELNFTLDEQQTRVVSRLALVRNPDSQSSETALVLAGENLKLIRIVLNEDQELTETDYHITPESLIIHDVPQQRPFTLTIENEINPKANTALEGLYLSNGMFCTQCEAEGFRKITYFLDRPDVMAKFTTTLVADKTRYPVLLSNGNKIAQGDGDNNQHWVTWEDPFSKPCYLFALVAGQLDANICGTTRHRQMRPRHAVAEKCDGLGRTGLRTRIRPRPVHDRCCQPFQYGRNGKQGLEYLQHQICAGAPRYSHRFGLRAY
jgi:aminopeptidase N